MSTGHAQVRSIGVAGAGTMGSGIAQIACLGGFETLLHDPDAGALEDGAARLRSGLERGAERGRWSSEDAVAATGRLSTAPALEDLAGCDLVIEAAPEDLDTKRDLFARLSAAGDPMLATNTSSLLVTAIATGAQRPERVLGMHFFNPPPLMRLVEMVAGADTAPDALDAAEEAGRRMGRTPVRAADGPGFLANRLARPYSLEALRIVGDRLAEPDTVDRACRLGGGFRMGPFELMDLVGVDVGLAVARSFFEQSFGEPRWQPHPLQELMVAAGRTGRKAGLGWYSYAQGSHRPEDPEPPAATGLEGARAEVAGEGRLAEELRALLGGAGVTLVRTDAVRLVPTDRASLTLQAPREDAVGVCAPPPLSSAPLVELCRGPATSDQSARTAESIFRSLGRHVEWVGDGPGLILLRILSQLVNEAAFAVQRGIGSAEDADTAMRLGFNWPVGPVTLGERMGLDVALGTLDGLRAETGEERYRAAPLLRRAVATGSSRIG